MRRLGKSTRVSAEAAMKVKPPPTWVREARLMWVRAALSLKESVPPREVRIEKLTRVRSILDKIFKLPKEYLIVVEDKAAAADERT